MVTKTNGFRRTLRRTQLFAKPSVFAGLIYFIWYAIRAQKPYWFASGDSQVLANAVAMIACFHAIIAALTLANAVSGRSRMYECLDCGDYVSFVQLRDERIFWPIHWMLGCFSFFLIMGTLIIHYDTLLSGSFVVISSAMVVSLYWQAAAVADNPLGSSWYEGDEKISEKFRCMTLVEARQLTVEERVRRELAENAHVRVFQPNSPEFEDVTRKFGGFKA